MSTNAERYRALNEARVFLYSLLDPKQTPRVPSEVRDAARAVLKHYPGQAGLQMMRMAGRDGS